MLLSPDLLDAATHAGFLSPEGLAVVDSGYRPPLSLMLDDDGDFDAEAVLEEFRRVRGDNFLAFPAGAISYAVFGKSVYASSMILGAAWQRGRVPFGLDDMEAAFRACFRDSDARDNLEAFAIGREIALRGDDKVDEFDLVDSQIPENLYVESIEESLLPWQNAAVLTGMFRRALDRLAGYLGDVPRDHLARYLHDMYIYDRGKGVEDFIANAGKLPLLYGDGDELKRALRTLAKTYFIKDEVFISHAMVSPLKRRRDEAFYGRLGKGYGVEPVNRPSFDLWGKKVEFDISPRPWMLRLMRHGRPLRWLLKTWHAEEAAIAGRIRKSLMEEVPGSEDRGKRLRELENIKGFRDVRYAKAEAVFGKPGAAA